jgi:hypothetical protein
MENLQTLLVALEDWGFTAHECGHGVSVGFRVGDDRLVALTLPTEMGFDVRVVAREPVAHPRRLQAKMVLRTYAIASPRLDTEGRLTCQLAAIEAEDWLAAISNAGRAISEAIEVLRANGVLVTPVPVSRRHSTSPA